MARSKRKRPLNVVLKTALAAIESHPLIKIPATLISAIADLPDNEQDKIADALQQNMDQSELATLNAADAAATSKRIEAFLRDHFQKITGTLLAPADSIIYLTYPPNEYFTGRKKQLSQLAKNLKLDSPTVITQTISGLGGVGKTQIALQYAYEFRNRYDSIIWLRADTEQTLTADLDQITQRLNLPPAKLEQNRANLIRWLTDHRKWLLVFDNADDPRRITSYLPPQGTGHILITSRATNFQDIPNARTIPIDKMTQPEAQAFLLRRTNLKRTNANKAAAGKLAADLDYLPLALEQAAAYVFALKITFEEYLDQYESIGTKIFEDKRARPRTGYDKSIHNTWSMNFAQVEKESPASADLLNLSAFLHPDSIPFFLIIESTEHLGPKIAAAFEQNPKNPKLTLAELIEPLTRFSLITRHKDKDAFSIHRLLQQVIRDTLNEKDAACFLIRDLDALYNAYPRADEVANWPLCARLTPHTLSVFDSLDEFTFDQDYLAEFLNSVAYYLDDQAQFAEAEPLYKRALKIDEAFLGKDHPDVARDLNNLASLYQATNRLKEAEPLMKRAVKIDEASFGKDHPNVATDLNNLAQLYKATNRLKEAEPLYQRALKIDEASFGSDHPKVAIRLNNLAQLYQATNRLKEAEPLMKRALKIGEASLGKDHPKVALRLNNLAQLYKATNRLKEAEPLMKRALAIDEASFGSDHPKVATDLNNLAQLYQATNRLDDAEPLMLRTLKIDEASFGNDHPDVARDLNNLAGLYQDTNRLKEAEPLMKRALAIDEASFGPDHPEVARDLNNLSAFYKATNRLAEAEPLAKRALKIDEASLGKDHPDVARDLNNLAQLYKATNRLKDAEPMYKRALEIWQKSLGKDHPQVAAALNNLAQLYKDTNRLKEAEPLCQRVVKIFEKSLGENHPNVATALNNLAQLYTATNRLKEAEPLMKRALKIFETSLGPQHPNTKTVRRNLDNLK